MAFSRKSGGSNATPAVVRRRSGGAWANAQTIRRHVNGAWVTAWAAVNPLVVSPSSSTRAISNNTGASQVFTASGGNGSYTFSLNMAPPGVTLSGSGASRTLTVTARSNTSLSLILSVTSNGETVNVPIDWSWGAPV